MQMQATSGVRLRFISSYMGGQSFEAIMGSHSFRVEIQLEATDYSRQIFNGSDDEYRREVLGKVGCVTRAHDFSLPVPEEVVAAVNQMYLAHHEQALRSMKNYAPAFRKTLMKDPAFKRPALVCGAHWSSSERVWIRQ